ncbi:PorV/PorQ family protein [candidate division KSB1 bacterium]|nr:PorV/PorQ family protein [candidate division KSB1 bacterium]
MKLIHATISVFILVIAILANPVWADNSPATTGFEFLRTEVGARPAAMSGAFVAVTGDPTCTFYNPAGLSKVTIRGGSLTYLKHLLDFHSGTVVGALPQKWGTIGFGINYINYGEFKETTEYQPDGTGNSFGANSFEVAVSASRMYQQLVSYGATVKYIRASISQYTSDAFAVNAGVIVHVPFTNDLDIGIAVFNYGQTKKAFVNTKDELPFNYRAGVSKKLAHLPLMLCAQIYKYTDDIFQWNIGGEFTLTKELFLRLGYNSLGRDQTLDMNADKFAGVNAGLGFQWRKYRIDYAFSSMGEIGSLNRFTFSTTF